MINQFKISMLRHSCNLMSAIFIVLFSSSCTLFQKPLPSLGDGAFPLKKVELKNATIETMSGAIAKSELDKGTLPVADLKITLGKNTEWPGVCFSGNWDLSSFETVEFHFRNSEKNFIYLRFRLDDARASDNSPVGHYYTGAVIFPGEDKVVSIPLVRLPDLPGTETLKGIKGMPKGLGAANGLDLTKIVKIVISKEFSNREDTIELKSIKFSGVYSPESKFKNGIFPIVDRFGQYTHEEWPGKFHEESDFKNALIEESADLKANPSPTDWDQYGGWAGGPTLEATGFFRTSKYKGKWWLVDPAGKLFFSNGIDCVMHLDYTPILSEGRDKWFETLPVAANFQTFPYMIERTSNYGDYKGKKLKAFSFIAWNMYRKYGPNWPSAASEHASMRLRSWGFNTLGTWASNEMLKGKKMPYVGICSLWSRQSKVRKIEGSSGYWMKVWDVYDPEFQQHVDAAVKEQTALYPANDPYLIGFFFDNEPAWGDKHSLGLAALKSPQNQPAKKIFIADLKEKYKEIAGLNKAWNSSYVSWEAILTDTNPRLSMNNSEDLEAFYTKTAEIYFKTARNALKKYSPNHLYLGCRFSSYSNANDLVVAAAAKYCDVVSYNIYRVDIADFALPENIDCPVLVGEYMFGATDRGVWHPGHLQTANQQERVNAFKNFLSQAMRHPNFVGAHWFQYFDQPLTGRILDGECYESGFVNIVDNPYPEMVNAARELGEDLYRTRSAGRGE